MKLNLEVLFRFFLPFFLISVISFSHASASQWKEEKSKHFVIKMPTSESSSWGRSVLRKAEGYYTKVTKQIGYPRYQNFWTWEERVEIIIYVDSETYIRNSGQPEWSRGGTSIRDGNLLTTRRISSYRQEGGFIDKILPHEISHLILRDFIGFDKNIPIWFDEGIAQLQEKNKIQRADEALKDLVKKQIYIPFELLLRYDIRKEEESSKVSLFYAQSLSVVHFLIQKFGSKDFGELCRALKSGGDFEEALASAYTSNIESMVDLEEKWVRFMLY